MARDYVPFAHDGAWRGPGAYEQKLREAEAGAEALNLPAHSIHIAIEIAALQPELTPAHQYALILLILISMAALQEGSTRFPVTGSKAAEPIRRMLKAFCGSVPIDDAIAAIEALLETNAAQGVVGKKPDDYKPLLYLKPYIYQQRIRSAEAALSAKLANLICQPACPALNLSSIREALADVGDRPRMLHGKPLMLSPEQSAAVQAALTARLTIISGGPGTGKTSIVLAILRVLARLGLASEDIALGAPTGKAAYRIRESFLDGLRQIQNPSATDQALIDKHPDPSTIHRLLGYSSSRARFLYHSNNQLAQSVLIVDESSMLDLAMMERLLDAIRPDARLILLGDADQLPSVAAGAIFRDLLRTPGRRGERSNPSAFASMRLTRSYRLNQSGMAGTALANVSRAVNEGRTEIFDSTAPDGAVAFRDSTEALKFEGVEYLTGLPRASSGLLDRWYHEQVWGDRELHRLAQRDYELDASGGFVAAEQEYLNHLFTCLARAKILCVTRVLDNGSERINAAMHRRAAHDLNRDPERTRFFPGEPVIVLHNDYERRLFNGDQGLVLRVRDGRAKRPTSMVVFARDGHFVAFGLDLLREELELCYAMTVHKAQGSEFDAIALILPDKDLPLLTREVVYTGISRARHSAVMIGRLEMLRLAISRKLERYSGLDEMLATV